MTFTYVQTLATDRDKVRFLTGDVVSTQALRSDEEIAGVLLMESNVYRAASLICTSLSGQFSRQADGAIDDVRRSLSQKATAFAARAKELLALSETTSGTGEVVPMPYAGGISIADREAVSANTDRSAPFFSRDDPWLTEEM